jgi:hypothetical protein
MGGKRSGQWIVARARSRARRCPWWSTPGSAPPAARATECALGSRSGGRPTRWQQMIERPIGERRSARGRAGDASRATVSALCVLGHSDHRSGTPRDGRRRITTTTSPPADTTETGHEEHHIRPHHAFDPGQHHRFGFGIRCQDLLRAAGPRPTLSGRSHRRARGSAAPLAQFANPLGCRHQAGL